MAELDLIKDNVAEVVANLKQQPGKDMGIVGSGTWSGRYFAMGSWTSSGSWSTLSSWAAGSACSRRRGSRGSGSRGLEDLQHGSPQPPTGLHRAEPGREPGGHCLPTRPPGAKVLAHLPEKLRNLRDARCAPRLRCCSVIFERKENANEVRRTPSEGLSALTAFLIIAEAALLVGILVMNRRRSFSANRRGAGRSTYEEPY